jgi:hypothetical protein
MKDNDMEDNLDHYRIAIYAVANANPALMERRLGNASALKPYDTRRSPCVR